MAIGTPRRVTVPTASDRRNVKSPPAAMSANTSDLLGALRWRAREVLAAAAIVLALDLIAGWVYEASYFGYFRVPLEGLGLTAQELLAQGARSLLLPLTAAPVAFVAGAPGRQMRVAAPAVGAYIVLLAYVAFADHFVSPASFLVQAAAAVVIGGTVLALRRGFGGMPVQKLALGALALLLVTSTPVAIGTLDASQKASVKQSTLRIATREAVLPGSLATAGLFTYSNYVLLRVSDSRYWLFRIGDQNTYSIAKSSVLYLRY